MPTATKKTSPGVVSAEKIDADVKRAAKRAAPIRKGTAPRGAARTKPASGKGSKSAAQLNGMTVRHGKVGDDVWERCEARAAREGRGIWEVVRQKMAEYGDYADAPELKP